MKCMEKISLKKLSDNFSFLSNNPQIVYTVFLLIVIPIAFLFSGQQFLSVSINNQERLEKERIGLMQDIFVAFAPSSFDNGAFLTERIKSIKKQNETITDFKIVEKTSEGYVVIASLNDEEVGTLDTDETRVFNYNFSLSGEPLIFQTQGYDGRHWRAVRSFTGLGTSTRYGVMYADVSMASVDSLFNANKRDAYVVLSLVIIAVGILLIRQARVIDYAVLYKRLKEVDQMKDDFISMAAHELRTPLTIIRGYTEMLSDSKRLTENDRQMTRNIEQSADNLNQLIGDILDVSRMQQGRLSFNLQDIQPESIISGIVESLKYTANQKGLQLSYEGKTSAPIRVDVDRLKQILINLVGNAVKYTPKGSVTVTSYVEKERYVIRVSDTGIGISAEDQQKLFSRFYRVRSKETEEIRGTGLGLWITKEIVIQMKGTISTESIKGKGTDFVVMFPIEKDIERA